MRVFWGTLRYFEVFWGIFGHFGIGAFWGIAKRWGPRGRPPPVPQNPPVIPISLAGKGRKRYEKIPRIRAPKIKYDLSPNFVAGEFWKKYM